MIHDEKNIEEFGKPYNELTIRTKAWFKCDYCGEIFQRDKKSRERLNQNAPKDSCGSKECKVKKKVDVSLALYGTEHMFQSDQFKKKSEDTNIKKYGSKNYFSSDDFQEKRKDTLLERYGVENPLQSTEIRAKQEATCEERYGVKNYSQTPDFKEKIKEASQEKYGVDSPMQSKEVLAKREQTCLEKYGTKSYTQTDEYWQKRRESTLDKYGVEHTHQLEEVRKKMKETNLERHGSENYTQSDEYQEKLPDVIEKRQETSIERYNKPHYSGSDEWLKKRPEMLEKEKQTNLEKYGTESFMQSEAYQKKLPEIQEHKKKTTVERYGVEHYTQSEDFQSRKKEIVAKTKRTNLEKYGVEHHFQLPEYKEKLRQIFQEKYGVPTPFLLPHVRPNGKIEREIADWLKGLGFDFEINNWSQLKNQELDLYCEDCKIAIEYCGLYWHTEMSKTPREKDYHYRKYKECEKRGIRLFTIFEDEWLKKEAICKGIIRSALGSFDTRLYARKCKLAAVKKSDYIDFCQQYHLQGASRHSIICFGLYDEDRLFAILSLGKHHRQSKSDTIVLDRLCFKSGIQIVGAASRLFAAARRWIKKQSYTRILTWSDNRWALGAVYKQMGFELERELGSDYSYVDLTMPLSRISKQSQKKSNTGCPEALTEHQWALERGLARIWDCGKKRWVFDCDT